MGAYILQTSGPSAALLVSFFIALLPPIIGGLFVPETLGMRNVDFNEEKKEEKIQRALSMEQDGERSTIDYILMSFSGEQRKPGGDSGANQTEVDQILEMTAEKSIV